MDIIEKLVPAQITECSISVVADHVKGSSGLAASIPILDGKATTRGAIETGPPRTAPMGETIAAQSPSAIVPISDCGTCMTSAMAKMIAREFVPEAPPNTPAPKIVEAAKKKLGCDSEKCVLQKSSHPRARAELRSRFKIAGHNDNKLLSNINIDNVLRQWMSHFPDFFAYNFNMIDYAQNSIDKFGRVVPKPDTLATINFDDLYNSPNKYRIAACVINSDVSTGPGKHWMALVADARGDGEWSVEFFNSSGNPPAPEWVNWMQKTKHIMERLRRRSSNEAAPNAESPPPAGPVVLAKSTVRHQYSNTECGVYSLFYIWARLCGVAKEVLLNNPIPDRLMFAFRQHLFENSLTSDFLERITTNGKFDWEKYQAAVKIRWD